MIVAFIVQLEGTKHQIDSCSKDDCDRDTKMIAMTSNDQCHNRDDRDYDCDLGSQFHNAAMTSSMTTVPTKKAVVSIETTVSKPPMILVMKA